MLKLLFILVLIALIASMLINGIKRKINNLFSSFKPRDPIDEKDNKDEVIYRKDDVVVLKGDAKKYEDKKE